MEIKYKGLSTVPSDFESEDGELAMALDAVNEVGDIRPLKKGTTVFSLAATDTVLFLHKNDNIVHYLIRRTTVTDGVATYALFYRTEDSATLHQIIMDSSELHGVTEVTSIGNTLILVRQGAPIAYLLWKGSASGYKFLGSHIPEIDLQFGLKGKVTTYIKENGGPKLIEWDAENASLIINERNHELATKLKALINPFIVKHVVDEGRFCFPFFVRFALRLYDGTTLVNHSAPILMTPSTSFCPAVIIVGGSIENNHVTDYLDLLLVAAQLQYRYSTNPELSDWEDIVKSVDIFITPPIYTYNVDGDTVLVQAYDPDLESRNLRNTRFIGLLQAVTGGCAIGSGSTDLYSKYASWSYWDLYNLFYADSEYNPWTEFGNTYPRERYPYRLPELSEDKKNNLYTDAYSFYLLKSVNIGELQTVMTDINVDEDVLKTLQNREVMTDDYRTHEHFVAATAYSYNNRLNIGNIKHSIFPGFSLEYMTCKLDKFAMCSYGVVGGVNTANVLMDITDYLPELEGSATYVQYEENAEDKIIKKDCGVNNRMNFIGLASTYHWPLFIYYPSANGKTLTIRLEQSEVDVNLTLKLRRHPFLNGSYCAVPFGTAWPEFIAGAEPQADNLVNEVYYSLPNRLFTSAVNNPFYFPVTGMNAIGNGSILKLASAAKAMSTGQFGEFPMYAFTTEGIFALSVSQDGTFSSRQPFTRDVAIPGSITQLDSTVVFITNRGLMSVSGSVLENLSEKIEADLFDISKLSGLTGDGGLLTQTFGITLPTFEKWKTFVKGDCRMLYDYDNERLYLYKPDGGYAYTLSLKSGYWAVSSVNIHKGINSYPDCLCEIDSEVVNLSVPSSERYGAALIITRPVKLNAAYSLKTIRDVVQIETSGSGLSQLLYGSRNGDYWELIDSSNDKFIRNITGNPYLYFRLVVIIASDEETTVNGAYINFIERVRQ